MEGKKAIHEPTRNKPGQSTNRLLKNAPRTLADPLCGSLCDLCVSVVSVFVRIFTTETQRTTEIAQRNRYPARADDFFSSLLGFPCRDYNHPRGKTHVTVGKEF